MKKYIIIALLGLITISCASGSNSNTETQSPVQTQPAVENQEKAQVSVDEKSVESEIPQELKVLREAVGKSEPSDIENLAHVVIDRMPDSPESAEALRVLAQLAISEKNYSKALLYGEAANTIQPDSLDNLLLLAEIAHLQERDSDAVKLYKKCIELYPNDSRAYLQKARILLVYLDTDRALESAAKAYELDSKNCETSVVYADALYASQKYEDAVNHYVQAQSLCSLSESALKNLAKLYEVNLQNPSKACEIYTKLTEIDPNNAYYKASRDYQCGL